MDGQMLTQQQMLPQEMKTKADFYDTPPNGMPGKPQMGVKTKNMFGSEAMQPPQLQIANPPVPKPKKNTKVIKTTGFRPTGQ